MNPQKVIHPVNESLLIIEQISVSKEHHSNRGFRVMSEHSAPNSKKSSVCNTPIHTSENLIHDIELFSEKLRKRGIIQ